jgi:hypothetical protein
MRRAPSGHVFPLVTRKMIKMLRSERYCEQSLSPLSAGREGSFSMVPLPELTIGC